MCNLLLSFTACGLVFDAIGVLLIGFAFFFKTKETLRNEAGTHWGSNPHTLKSLISSKFDGMAGTLLLFIGFIYQVFGYAQISNDFIVTTSYIVLVIFIVLYLSYIRPSQINKWHEQISTKDKKISYNKLRQSDAQKAARLCLERYNSRSVA